MTTTPHRSIEVLREIIRSLEHTKYTLFDLLRDERFIPNAEILGLLDCIERSIQDNALYAALECRHLRRRAGK